MDDFISLIISTIILISIFIYYESKYSDLIYVKSSVDNQEYLVRNRDDKEDAAILLANINLKLKKLIEILELRYGDNENVLRLINKFNPNKIRESISNTKHTSYSVNKGEKIVFCIRNKTKAERLIKINTMMFVAIHELAHIMTVSIGHTEEFWNNMRFLLKIAIKHNIYKKQDFKKKPIPYCGTVITDTPLE